MRYLLLSLFLSSLLFAGEKMIVESKKFFSDEKKGFIEFTEDVFVKKLHDTLNTEKLIVKLDKNNKPLEYETYSKTYFKINLNEKNYKGSSNKVIYIPKELKYILIGNVHIKELETDNTIDGERIVFDKKIKQIRVKGESKKPVKFTFDVENGEK